jgi:outer membrane protein TolC
LQLADSRPLDIALAAQRIEVAAAQLDRARALWLPTIQLGTDYFRHDGRIQDVTGNVFDTSKSSLLIGGGPVAVFAITDALYVPLAARQVVRAREASLQAAANDSLLAVAEAYFNVLEARGELAGAQDAVRQAEELLRRAQTLASPEVAIIPTAEVFRARAEVARRRQAVQVARERWRTASADLVRVLRLEAPAVVEPLEPPQLRVTLLAADLALADLIPLALTNRPELAAQQALVQATLEQLRQERARPFLPSLLVRGASTNPAGTLGAGVFGGGINESLNHFGARLDYDVQLLWELQNLGLGNRARVKERQAEHGLTHLEYLRIQDRIVAEVTQAHAEVEAAAARVPDAESELRDAVESLARNFEGMRQPKGGTAVINLVNRPQEVVAAVQALAQAYNDYFGAIGDYNRAQFRLYHALGHPAQLLTAGCPRP